MSFPDSIAYIIKELSTRKKVKPSDVVKIIGNAKVNSLDLEPWKDFNHPSTSSYGRKMIFKSSNFEIMVMSWAPGDMSAIHNHGYTTWGQFKFLEKMNMQLLELKKIN